MNLLRMVMSWNASETKDHSRGSLMHLLSAGTGGDVLGSTFAPQAREYIRKRLASLSVEMLLDERLVAHEVKSQKCSH